MAQNPSPTSLRLINLGCSKNQVDSENILSDFHNEGYAITPHSQKADIVILNTCGFIESAKQESINEILAVAATKTPTQKIVVAGCLAERYQNELRREIPEVDYFFGIYDPGKIVATLKKDHPPGSECKEGLEGRYFLNEAPHHAYLKIAEGCNRVCGFCAIPLMRGKQHSRSIASLVKEAQDLQSRGIVEVSLVAQDLTFYGREKSGGETLAKLLRALLNETDIPWFRLMYAYPAYIDEELYRLFATEPRLCNYLDIPIQHASPAILKSMRRGYTSEQMRNILTDIRTNVPDIALRTTVLVGYPGETEDDFQQLLDFMGEIKFNRLGGFTYSDEDGTYAAEELKADRVPEEVMQERLSDLMALQQDISLDHNQALVGKEFTVLIDEVDAESREFPYIGRTEYDAPEIDNTVLIRGSGAVAGTFRRVKVTDGLEFDLEADLLPE